MTFEKLETAAAYTVAAIILGCMVYFTPLLFIGLVLGYGFGIYHKKIADWYKDSDDSLFGEDKEDE